MRPRQDVGSDARARFADAHGNFVGLLVGSKRDVPAQVEHLWTIMIHSRFPDGSEYDFVLVRGVPTANLDENLAICGRSHGVRQEMKYHCYAVPE